MIYNLLISMKNEHEINLTGVSHEALTELKNAFVHNQLICCCGVCLNMNDVNYLTYQEVK